jgi:hypothetical protein
VNNAALNANSASEEGGGLYNDGTSADLTDSQVSLNHAPVHSGAGIYLDSGTVTLSSTSVVGNFTDNCAPLSSIAGCTG